MRINMKIRFLFFPPQRGRRARNLEKAFRGTSEGLGGPTLQGALYISVLENIFVKKLKLEILW